MKTQENMAVITRFIEEVWNKGKESAIDELYVPEGIAKGLGKEYEEGPAMFKLFHQLMLSTCGDINVKIKHIMAEGDYVMLYATFDCIHKATGKKLHMEGGGPARIKDGKIIEAYNAWTFIDLPIQLGMLPANILPMALTQTRYE